MAHILISDDSASMRQMLAFTLTEADHKVTEACDGLSALALAEKHAFDLVITDMHMPQLDGLSLVAKLRTLPHYQYKPILLISTEADTEKKKMAKAVGATGWIVKPFNPDKLLTAINRVLR